MEKKGNCSNCKNAISAVLHKNISRSGSESFTWVCPRCNWKNPFQGNYYISKEEVSSRLTSAQIECLPLLIQPSDVRCAVCGNRNAEQHHWAPTAIFGKNVAEQWPKDYLCKKHHDEWHKTVTPQLVK